MSTDAEPASTSSGFARQPFPRETQEAAEVAGCADLASEACAACSLQSFPRHVPLLGLQFSTFHFSFPRGGPRRLQLLDDFLCVSCCCCAPTRLCRVGAEQVYRVELAARRTLEPSRGPMRCSKTPTAYCRSVGPFPVDLHGQQCGSLVLSARNFPHACSPSAESS